MPGAREALAVTCPACPWVGALGRAGQGGPSAWAGFDRPRQTCPRAVKRGCWQAEEPLACRKVVERLGSLPWRCSFEFHSWLFCSLAKGRSWLVGLGSAPCNLRPWARSPLWSLFPPAQGTCSEVSSGFREGGWISAVALQELRKGNELQL